MRFFTSSALSALFISVAVAQIGYNNYQNPFKVPASGLSAVAGQPMTIAWNPTTGGTVSLILRTGSSSDLSAGTNIALGIQNSGSFIWTPPTSITRGSDYTIEIVDDQHTYNTNYTPYFVIDSQNTVAYSTSQDTLGAPTTTIARATASPTGSAASYFSTVSGISVASSSDVVTMTAATTTIVLSSASASSDSGSSAASSPSNTAISASAISSAASTLVTSTAGGASTASATSSASVSAFTGAAPRATVMAGALGLVAVAAMAL